MQAPIADYDRYHDVLYVSYGPPRSGYGDPDDDNDMLIWRYDHAGNPMGFTVVNYSRTDKAEIIGKLLERGWPGVEVLP